LDDQLLIQMVDFPTNIKGNIPDLFLTNIPERVMEIIDNSRLGSSDHVMLIISVQVGKVRQPANKVKNWRKADWDKMRADMRGVIWKRELHGLTVDCMWAVLKRKVETTVKENVPLRMEACRGRPCWINREILAALRRKKRLWRQVRGGGLTKEYREADKKMKNLIRNAKGRFEKKLANKEGGSNQPFFAYIKRKTKSTPCIGPLKDSEKKVVTEDEGMVKIIKEFFSSVFTREDVNSIPVAELMRTEKLENVQITKWQLRKKIRKLRPASAAGPDGIGPRLLQELESELVEGLVLIFQLF
jgi:hypothetical protein